jgi:hypothetical protein
MKKLSLLISVSLLISSTSLFATNYYWVGGTGNWSDFANHWATSSSGTVFHVTIPSPSDDVFFDGNSFLNFGDTVNLDTTTVNCKNMDWTAATNTPRFQGANAFLKVYGSITLINAMTFYSSVYMESGSTGNTITTAAHLLNGFKIEGSGEWTLMDTLNTYAFTLTSGVFNSNNQVINCNSDFTCSGLLTQTVNLGTSVINVGGTNWQMNSSNLTMNADSSTINMINGGSIFYGGNYIYNNLLITGNGGIYGNNSFTKVIVNSDLSITGNIITDTLLMTTAGQLLTLDPGSVTTINSFMNILSNPGFPTTIQCNNGTATISQSTDTVCADYLYLKNITATGGAIFFAGDHSVDLGGNSGWIWTRCSPLISNVWPGDCNYDLVTDNFDLLNIGVAYGDTGYVRPGASLAYTAQPCQDWYYQFLNGVNVKHADCDGNGIVDGPDSTAISLNYGLTHPARLSHSDESSSVGPELAFDIPPLIIPGSALSVPITLGTSSVTADNIYGIAFTVDYDPAFITPGTMSVDYSGSWVENSNNHLHIKKDFPGAGKTDIAFTRIDHADISGYGMIATLHFVVSPNANGPFSLGFSHIRVISHNEIEIPVQVISGTTYVGLDENTSSISSVVFPNPVTNTAQIFFSNSANSIWTMTMTDITGANAYDEMTTTGNTFLIEKKNLRSGVYFYTLKNASGKFSKGKLIIQ